MDPFFEAKEYFKAEDWVKAKDALLKIAQNAVNNNTETNQKAFGKLAEVCCKLNDLRNAKMYYLKSIELYNNAQNEEGKKIQIKKKKMLYFKYAKFLHFDLKEYDEAESVYSKCIKMDKFDGDLYFHFAKFLTLIKKYENAKKCYLQCLELSSSPKASIHFNFGMLLYYNLMDKKNGIYHIEKAVKIKPNIIQYHFEFALMLKNENDPKYYQRINECFETALKLTNYQNTEILVEFGMFLIKYMNQKEKGSKFMELASTFNENVVIQKKEINVIRRHHIKENKEKEILNASNISSVMLNVSNDHHNYESLKYIVYDFDQTITFWDLYDFIHGDISFLFTMNDEDFSKIFGLRDRIRRISKHFEDISSKGIRIILLFVNRSNNYIDIVHEALKKVYLDKFFDEIIKIDGKNEVNDKLKYIKYIKNNHQLKHNEILYVDDNRKVIELMRNHCFSIIVPEQKGLRLRDIENIEKCLNIPTTNYSSFQSNLSSSWIAINGKLYYDIKTEIHRTDYDGNIDKLEVIQWLRNNQNMDNYKDFFIEFATKYALLCYFSSKHDSWICHEILSILLEIEPFDSDLNGRMARDVNSLGDAQKAEEYYKKAIRGRYISSFAAYGHFLLKQHRYNEGIEIFNKALKISPLSIKSTIAIGRLLTRLEDYENAEYWFKKAVALDPTFDLTHFRYASYLYEIGEYKEAEKRFISALEIWPHSDLTHFMMALNYFAMNDMDRFKYHLERCLDINPGHPHAKKRYYRHFDRNYNPSTSKQTLETFVLNGRKKKPKQRLAPQHAEKEFAIFWFDKLEMWLYDNHSSQVYYECFKQNDLNNIMSLFSVNKPKLREIGIQNEEHIEIILDAIDKHIIIEYEQFKEWLGSIVLDKRLLDEFCDAFRNYVLPIYSFESFYRNASRENKLRAILGGRHRNLVAAIWHSYDDTFNV